MAEAPADPEAATLESLAQAERVLGVSYTAAERAQLLPLLERELAQIRARRAHALPEGLAPATRFDPRLPDWQPAPEQQQLVRSKPSGRPLPSDPAEIAFAPLTQLAEWIAARALRSADLTEIYLERLVRLGPRLECVIEQTPELARAQARRADAELAAGELRGPLHGIPYGAKDHLDTAGIRTTWGAEPYRERVPQRSAHVVERLEQAGAVLAAKLSLGALAWGDVWFGGWTRSPWHPEDGASGSSAGPAAAVAAGLVGFAIGSETLGSIVSPCTRCGAAGLRPTFGRVSRAGAMPLSFSLDKLGPIARRAEDTLLVLGAIHGADPGDPSAVQRPLDFHAERAVAGRRIGFFPDELAADDHEPRALVALRELGAELVPLPITRAPYRALQAILRADAAALFEPLTLEGRDDELRWQERESWPNALRAARFISAVDYVQADRLRHGLMRELAALLQGVEAIAASASSHIQFITNFTGHPSLTLRAGFAPRRPIPAMSSAPAAAGPLFDAPRGVTLYGRLYEEGRLCELGLALETALGVWDRRPPVA